MYFGDFYFASWKDVLVVLIASIVEISFVTFIMYWMFNVETLG